MFVKIFFFLLLTTIATSKIPPYIHVCGLRNPKLRECVIKSVRALREKLSEGIPELNVPPTTALVLNDMSFINLTDLNINSKKARIYGAENFTVTDFTIDLKNQHLYTTFEYKFLLVEAECDFHAKILVPINGKETILSIAYNFTAHMNSHYKFIKKDDKRFIYFDSMNAKIDLKDIDTNVKKTAENENSVLVKTIDTILGTNKADIIRVIVPNIEKGISNNIINIANNIVKNFEFDELFPDRE